jgi:hypothetical protein
MGIQSKPITMQEAKHIIKCIGIAMLIMYGIVTFISYLPNPSDWGVGGRAAFLFFGSLVGLVTSLFNNKN